MTQRANQRVAYNNDQYVSEAEVRVPFRDDAFTAEECFLTSISLCLCPDSTINGRRFGTGPVPGPVTAHLTEAYSQLVGCDLVGQFKRHLA